MQANAVTEKALKENIYQILVNIHIPKALHSLVLTWIQREHKNRNTGAYTELSAYKCEYALIQKKIEGLIDMRASGLINDSEYQDRRERMELEKTDILRLTQRLEKNTAGLWGKIEDLLSLTETAVGRFQNGSSEYQRGILTRLGWNLFINQKRLDLTKENWIWPVIQIAKHIKSIYPTSEPVLSPYYKAEIENLLNSEKICSLLHDVGNLL